MGGHGWNAAPLDPMIKRPLSITVIGWLFITVGTIALGYHLLPQHIQEVRSQLIWICVIRGAAVVGGVFMLYRFNWARWLLVVWGRVVTCPN